MKKNKNINADFIIGESIPRFCGIDSPSIAYVKCDFLNINGRYIVSKESKINRDILHFTISNRELSKNHDISLVSDEIFNKLKTDYTRFIETETIDGLTYCVPGSILIDGNDTEIVVTPEGFNKHFTFKCLRKDFCIKYIKNSRFNVKAFKINEIYKISPIHSSETRYGILKSINDNKLVLLCPGNNKDEGESVMRHYSINDFTNDLKIIEHVDL